MSTSNENQIPRRTFLKGAAGVLAATTAGGALGKVLAPRPPLSVAWWDGNRLIPATDLPAGVNDLERVDIKLQGFGEGSILFLDSLYTVPSGRSVRPVAFRAWSPRPSGCARTRLVQAASEGLSFDVRVLQGKSELQVPVTFTQKPGAGCRLREGLYVLAEGVPDWGGYRLDLSQEDAPLRILEAGPATFQYLLIEIARA